MLQTRSAAVVQHSARQRQQEAEPTGPRASAPASFSSSVKRMSTACQSLHRSPPAVQSLDLADTVVAIALCDGAEGRETRGLEALERTEQSASVPSLHRPVSTIRVHVGHFSARHRNRSAKPRPAPRAPLQLCNNPRPRLQPQLSACAQGLRGQGVGVCSPVHTHHARTRAGRMCGSSGAED